MRMVPEIVTQASIFYRKYGFWSLVKAALAYFLKRCTFPLVRIVVRRARFRKLMRRQSIKLHLGCGSVHLNDYVNIDIEDWAYVCDVVADATNLYMFEDNSVEHIFTHALLEHIPPWDTMRTLGEWNRVLKPGGTIQIEVPDLERVFRDWLVDKTLNEQDAINNIYGGNKSPNRAYSSHQDHLTGFTYDRLTRMMADCGFADFKRLEHPKYHHVLVVWAQKAEV
jgi:predicted SAM-dependent methyltransferase